MLYGVKKAPTINQKLSLEPALPGKPATFGKCGNVWNNECHNISRHNPNHSNNYYHLMI